MLYVFHVDTGTMMTFDMKLALGSVEQLKESIEKGCRIPVDKQVLLVSGGECLDPAARVCSYSAGTDTNPIYLFSKSALENAKPPSPNFNYGSDSDIKELVDASLSMPVHYSTVVARAQLAQQFCELAREHTRVCEGLVHDQHLQQQGWAAAVANLEDITSAFKTKSEMFEQSYKQHLEGREENLKILENFSKDLEMLSKIPILRPLMQNALSFSNSQGTRQPENSGKSNTSTSEEESKEDNTNQVSEMTLLMWISAADDQSSLEQMAEQAQRSLEQLDEEVLESLNSEVRVALDASNTSGMKEIKGLGERLFGLEQLMVETKKIVQEQSDLAQALVQNQNRAGILNDDSILPDLCASHRKQLLVMWQNQHMLCDIRRRCFKAKEELSINLYHRLGWVMYVENLIMSVSNKLMIYHENLKRLRRYVEITRQVQKAPQVYVSAVTEVVRRKNFSQAFLTWASDMSCRLLAVYNEEFEKRREFHTQFEGHFLQSLFPGFEDNPPPFATQAPAPFDVNLPKLTEKDMERLKEYLPELQMSTSVTKLSAIAQMFLTKSISETKSSDSKENMPVEDRLVAAVSEAGLSSKLDEALLQPSEQEGERVKAVQNKDDRDFESETDTEEFEKVCQSPVDNGVPPESKYEVGPLRDMSPTSSLPHPPPFSNQEFMTTDFYFDESMPSTYSVSSEGVSHSQVTPFQENVDSKSEVEVLRYHLSAASKLANQTANHLKAELKEMKNSSVSDREAILLLVKDIQSHISGINTGYLEEIENLHIKLNNTVLTNEQETMTLKKTLKEKEELLREVTEDMGKIKSILEDTENERQGLSESLSSSQQMCQELQMKLEDAAQEKIKTVQAVSDKLTADYQQKITSLEEELTRIKDERDKEMIEEREKLNHDFQARMVEMKSSLIPSGGYSPTEKDELVSELKDSLSMECSKKLEEMKKKLQEEAEVEKQKAVKEASEKIVQTYKTEIENLRSRFKFISAANMDKSPSETGLEKIERLDTIDLSQHEAVIMQLKEDAALEKEMAVKGAIEAEEEKYKFKLEEELKIWKSSMEEEKQIWLNEAINRAMTEKSNQIESLSNRQENLVTECQSLRDIVKLITDGEQIRPGSSPGAGILDPLLERIEILEKEKMALVTELEEAKCRIRPSEDMSVSVAVMTESEVSYKDATTSPGSIIHSDRVTKVKSGRTPTQHGKISITSCSVGDEVLILWNKKIGNYTILQEAPTLYLIHPDCLDCLGLKLASLDPDGLPAELYCVAQVTDKEYCQVKRSENKFRVPKGTKFYRVKVRPLMRESKEISSPKYQQQQKQEQQQSAQAPSPGQSDELSASQQLIKKNNESSLIRSLDSPQTSAQFGSGEESGKEYEEKKEFSTSR